MADGAPALPYTVVAFPADRGWWQPPHRRVRAVRPASDGSFLIDDVRPGAYYLAAVIDATPDEWLDAAFLGRLVPLAVSLTINAGEAHRQDLRLR